MSAVNNREHNKRVFDFIKKNNAGVKDRLNDRMVMEQEIILKDALTSLDLKPAVNREEGNKRVENIVKYYKGNEV